MSERCGSRTFNEGVNREVKWRIETHVCSGGVYVRAFGAAKSSDMQIDLRVVENEVRQSESSCGGRSKHRAV